MGSTHQTINMLIHVPFISLDKYMASYCGGL